MPARCWVLGTSRRGSEPSDGEVGVGARDSSHHGGDNGGEVSHLSLLPQLGWCTGFWFLEGLV